MAVRKILPDRLRHRYANSAWTLGFRLVEFFDRTASVWAAELSQQIT